VGYLPLNAINAKLECIWILAKFYAWINAMKDIVDNQMEFVWKT